MAFRRFNSWFYSWLGLTMLTLAIIFLGVMLFVIPRLEKSFDDAGVSLFPPVLQFLNFSRWLGGRLPGQNVPGVVYLLIMSLVAAVAWTGIPRETQTS